MGCGNNVISRSLVGRLFCLVVSLIACQFTVINYLHVQGFLVKDLSQHFNALVIFIEHRYYGYSLPFGAASYKDAQHLAYLTSEQALADFAAVIQEVKVSDYILQSLQNNVIQL